MPDGKERPVQLHNRYQKQRGDVRQGSGRLQENARHPRSLSRVIAATDDDKVGCAQKYHDRSHGNPPRPVLLTGNTNDLTFYPAFTHKSSPTYFTWVKLTAHSIHHTLSIINNYHHSWLSSQKRYQNPPQLLFYRNHPIQFVQVIGVVVSIEEYFERFWLFTIDDSSGVTVDVTCRKPEKRDEKKVGEDLSEEEKEEQLEICKLSDQVVKEVQIGTVLQVKGTITLFQRNKFVERLDIVRRHGSGGQVPKQEQPVRQIALQRLAVVHDTNHEIKLMTARTDLYKNVLNRPWVLTDKQIRKLKVEAEGEAGHEQKRVRKRKEKDRKREELEQQEAQEILREYEQEQRRREEEAEMARKAGMNLNIRNKQEMALETAVVRNTEVLNVAATERHNEPQRKEKRCKRKSSRGTIVPQSSIIVAVDEVGNDTTGSFAPQDEERSALLRAAFS